MEPLFTKTSSDAEGIPRDLQLKPPKVAPYGMKQLYLTGPDGWKT
jgi:hypothetical protein